MNEKMISIETPEGTLVAALSSDPNHPGIYVELIPKESNRTVNIALVEHNDLVNNLAVMVWGRCYAGGLYP